VEPNQPFPLLEKVEQNQPFPLLDNVHLRLEKVEQNQPLERSEGTGVAEPNIYDTFEKLLFFIFP